MEPNTQSRVSSRVNRKKEKPMNTAKLKETDRAMIEELMRQPVAPPVTTTPFLDRIR